MTEVNNVTSATAPSIIPEKEVEDINSLTEQLKQDIATLERIEKDLAKDKSPYESVCPQIQALIVEKVALDRSMTWDEAAKAYSVSHSAIAKILLQWDDDPKSPPLKRGRKSFTTDMLIFVLSRIEHDSKLTLKELVNEIQSTFQVEISNNSLSSRLRSVDVNWKNELTIPIHWNEQSYIDARSTFVCQTIPSIRNRTQIYIKEIPFNFYKSGNEPHARLTNTPKEKHVSVIAALGLQGIIHYTIINHLGKNWVKGSVADNLQHFLCILTPKLRTNAVVILDSVSS